LFSAVVVLGCPVPSGMGFPFLRGKRMDWILTEDSYNSTDGIRVIRYWVKRIQGEHITLEVVAGDLRRSEPNEFLEDPSSYTQVAARASSNATSVYLYLSHGSEVVYTSPNNLTSILNALEEYSGTRTEAYTALKDIL